jgi:hypothetical protein
MCEQAVALCHRIGASNYVDVSVYEVVGLGAALKEIIELGALLPCSRCRISTH